ncbi:UNVERIFIED_CONTAM: Copia protein [Sesamum latifolium]|uniref:Copia protein n=1 Tax=Sesamum latifolium TaxID=2727402 RepID=A0AAW2TAZ1_9LAMI
MNGLEKSIHELNNMLVQYEATTRKSEPSVLVGEASTSKAKGKGTRRWKRKKVRERRSQPLPALGVLLLLPRRKRAKERSGVLSSRRQMMCAFIAMERGTGRGSVHNSSPTQVLQRSRKLSKDEMILRLGDGKAIAAEAVGSLSLVSNLIMTAQHKRKVDDHENAQIWHARLGHISKDRIRRGGFSYFITFTDDHSRYGYVYLMRRMGFSLSGLLLGRQLNGVAERRNRTLLDMVRSMMSFTELPRPSGVMHLRRQSTREYRAPERYGFVGLTSQLDKDPKTYGEVMSDIDSDKWLEAMKSEMDSMGSNQVWTLVDPPKGVRPVGCKWVYKRKLGANREVTAFKARLVAKGYTQRPEVDFEETYSAVVMAKSIRILLAIEACRKVSLLLEKNRRSVVSKGPSTASSKLPEVETRVFDEVIRGSNFIKNDYDPCVYKKISGSLITYLVLYVDDILLIGNDVKMLGDIKAWLSTQFSMKDMGEASYILGIKIYRDRSRRMLGLTQSSYIEKVLKRFRMETLETRSPSHEAWN